MKSNCKAGLRSAFVSFERPALLDLFKENVGENPQSLVHRVQHAAPACPRGKMSEGVENADKALEKSGLRVVVAGGVHGPINQKRTAHNRAAIYEAPVAAVRAAVSVVAHGK